MLACLMCNAGEYRSQGSIYAHGFHRETERSPHKFIGSRCQSFEHRAAGLRAVAGVRSGWRRCAQPGLRRAQSRSHPARHQHRPDVCFERCRTHLVAPGAPGGDDYVLDHISIDPQDSNRIYVSAWSVSSQQIGEIFRTRDGGRNWETLARDARQIHPCHGHVQG